MRAGWLLIGCVSFAGGQEPTEALIRHLGSEYAERYQQEAKVKLLERGSAVLSPLIDTLSHRDLGRQEGALFVLGELRDRRAVPFLLRFYETAENPVLKCRTLEALGKQKNDDLFEFFVYQLSDRDPSVKSFALWSLGELRTRRATAPIKKILAQSNGYLSVAAVDALGKTGDADVVADVLEYLKFESSQMRLVAARALGELGQSSAIAPLMYAMSYEPSLEAQEQMAIAVGKLADEPTMNRLLQWLSDPAYPDRQRLAEIALKGAGMKSAMGLGPLLRHKDVRVKLPAARILAFLKAPEAIGQMLDILETKDESAQIAAMSVLGEYGSLQTIPKLDRFVTSKREGLRLAAADAIRKIAERGQARPYRGGAL
jgi:HEAT repeat protein